MTLSSTVALGGGAAVAASESDLGNRLAPPNDALARGRDRVRIGLIGCGARGKAAAIEAIQAAGSDAIERNGAVTVQLAAMADTQASQLQTAYRTINGRYRDAVDVGSRRFVGTDAWRGVLASDVDLVILATPPEYRAEHFEAAVHVGKHVFMECPIALDPHDVQRIEAAGVLAKQAGLAVAVGHHRRHELRTRQCVAKLQEGIIGDLMYARTYHTDLDDDRHVHSLDLINWIVGHAPVTARGFGNGEVGETAYQLIEFTYANDFPVITQCRKTRGGSQQGEFIYGTHGTCDLHRALVRDRSGKLIWQSDAKEIPGKGWQRQFNELIAHLQSGHTPFELDSAVASTAAAILGRDAVKSADLLA